MTATINTNVNVKKHDWGMFAGGIAVALIGLVIMFWPGATLLTLAMIAGVFFVFAGVAEIVGYFAYKGTGLTTGWQIAGGICNLILGAIFLLNPLWSAMMLPWIAGIAIICYGIFSIVGGVQLRKVMPSTWGWFIANGIVGIVCGIIFMMVPESFVLFLGIFMICRGATMMIYGATTPKIEAQTTYSVDNDETGSAASIAVGEPEEVVESNVQDEKEDTPVEPLYDTGNDDKPVSDK